jgi:hypothetical protein
VTLLAAGVAKTGVAKKHGPGVARADICFFADGVNMRQTMCAITTLLARQMFCAYAACITWPFGKILSCMNTRSVPL